MCRKATLLLTFFALALVHAVAQTGGAGGTVVYADDGSPVVGATVEVKGHKTGTVTDAQGRFQIADLRGGHTLAVSYVGMKSVEVGARQGLTIRLVAEEHAVDEVIVVAFGKQKRESFTGSAGVLDAKQIENQQVSNPLAALNGRVAGVQMVEGNTSMSTPSINIRGISSLNAGVEPLIVLDGLPYNGYMSDINPQDVESITVLKDAASTSLYGARGANGVIMITTKQAKRGQAVVSLDAKWGSNANARVDYECLDDPGQYYELYYGAHYRYNTNVLGQDPFTAHRNANAALYKNSDEGGLGTIVMSPPAGQLLIGTNGKLNPAATLGNLVMGADGKQHLLLPDDWKKVGLKNGLRQEYNVNINGGTDQFQAMLSLGYMNNEGVVSGQEYERYTGRFKADWQAKPWLRIGTNASYTHCDDDLVGNSVYEIQQMPRIYPVYIRDAEGNIMTDTHGRMYDYGNAQVTGCMRPQDINENDIQGDMLDVSNNSSNSFGAQAYADITFLKDFKLTANISIYDTENRTMSGYNPYYGYTASTKGSMTTAHYRTFAYNSQQLLNWSHDYGAHRVSALLGHEYTKNTSKSLSAGKTGFIDFDGHKELNALLSDGSISGTASDYNIEGYFFRGQYEYDGKYFASASFRRDGSSRFHPDHRWGNFWSAGAAWIVNKEKWQMPTWIDMLKVKASIGQQGNDAIGSYYYTDYYAFATAGGEGALNFSSKGNPDITWETNTNVNAGIEFELFGKRLRGGVEYYWRKTSDMLMWFTAPQSIGYSGYYDNVGDMVNQGVELTLDGDIIRTKDLVWSLNLNLSHNRNRVTSLPQENRTATIDGSEGYISSWHFVGEGLPVNTWYMHKYVGVGTEGQPLYAVRNADGTLGTTDSYSQSDYFLCGDPNPSVFGGFGTSLSAYGFDLSVLFNYSIGGKALDSGYMTAMACPYTSITGNRIHRDMLNAWTETNTETDVPRFQYGDESTGYWSSRFLTDASYLALRNITLGYTFPKALVKKLSLSSLRLFVNADNIYYWTKRRGFDPRSSLTGEPLEVDYMPMRTISAGISVKF